METQIVRVGDVALGAGQFKVIAGPCAIESREGFFDVAATVKEAGAAILRGGMFKLRTDPRSFQGLGYDAIELVREARKRFAMPFVTEITDPRQIEKLEGEVDLYQVGSRNMHNYALLKELGGTRTPVLLKRGLSALLDEWLLAAEYLTKWGNPNVVLCERGIRTFERATRNTLDLSAVAAAKLRAPFPVVVDPSHATGRPDLIPPLSRAALAVGADGLMVEVHDRPDEALSDGPQALRYPPFRSLMAELKQMERAWKSPS